MKKIILSTLIILIGCAEVSKPVSRQVKLNEGISIPIQSKQAINGISMSGKMNVVMIGDARNTITGDAVLTFTRERDNQSFSINAPKIGFTPKDKDCIPSYYEENKDCIIDLPILFDLQDEDIIYIQDDLIKVKSMFTGGRNTSEYDTYKIINNENFDSEFLYRFPENASFNDDGSFTYGYSKGSYNAGFIITIGEVQGKWIKVKEIEYECYVEKYNEQPFYKVSEYNQSSGQLELVINTNKCPE